MSGIGGGGGGGGAGTDPFETSDPFAPEPTTTDPFAPEPTTQPFFSVPTTQTSVFNPFAPNPATTPTSSSLTSPLTISEVITKTKANPSLSAQTTLTPKGTNTLTIADSGSQNHNNNKINNNTMSTAAIVFSIMIGFIVVGGCIALMFARKKPPENKNTNKIKNKNKRKNIPQGYLYGTESNGSNETNDNIPVYNQINSISPPLNLPPPPPSPPLQRFPQPPPRHSSSSPPPPRHSLPPPPRHSSLPTLPRHSPPTPPRKSPPPRPRRSLTLPPIPQHPPIVLYRSPSVRNGSSTRDSRNYHDLNFSEHDPIHSDHNYHYQRYSQLKSQSSAYHNNMEDQPTNIDEPP